MEPPPRRPPALPEEIVEEILVQFPPEDPASLVRAALVCKAWRGLVSSPGFRRRFRDFHRAAPMLGFLCCQRAPFRFESTTSFRAHHPVDGNGGDGAVQIQRALDARHGRVLLCLYSPGSKQQRESKDLAVWDPVRGDLQTLPAPRYWCLDGWTAAVVCAAAGCDHLDCARGPFLVVCVFTDRRMRFVTCVCVYSSEDRAWSVHRDEVTVVPDPDAPRPIKMGPSVLMGNALYFPSAAGILKHNFDLGTEIFEIIWPPAFFVEEEDNDAILMTTEVGNLGLAFIQQPKLVLWSRQVYLDSNGEEEDSEWVQSGVIELSSLLPDNALLDSARLVGFADSIAVILLQNVNRLFTIDIKSSCVKEIAKGGLDLDGYHVVPFVSFCTPALEASSGVRPGASASTASQT